MRLFVTGGSGVLGRELVPQARRAGHDVVAPRHHELDLFDAGAVHRAVRSADAVIHLATRIPAPETMRQPDVWAENDRLRAEASRVLVDAAVGAGCDVHLQPTITFLYPREGAVDESTPVGTIPAYLASALEAEAQAARFTEAGRRGVVLRLGLLWGPGAWTDAPDLRYGATLHVEDAGRALLAALKAPAGIHNVVSDGQRVSNERFKRVTGWRPLH